MTTAYFLIQVAPILVSGNPWRISWKPLDETRGAKVRRMSLTVQLRAVANLLDPAHFGALVLQEPFPAFGVCHKRGLRATDAVPEIRPRQGSHHCNPVAACVGRGCRKTRWHGHDQSGFR